MDPDIVEWGRFQRGCTRLIAGVIILVAVATHTASADALSRLQSVRQSGCEGLSRYEAPLERLGSLDLAARLWATGTELDEAMDRAGYTATQVSTLHVHGGVDALMGADGSCRTIRDSAFRAIGVYQSGTGTWLILAAPAYPGGVLGSPRRAALVSVPSPAKASAVAGGRLPERVLDLVNLARKSGRRCGKQYFPTAAPVQLSNMLNTVAFRHAADMAQHAYFEHVDLDGKTPAERVKAAGYRERLVGENIAYGPTSAQEVVAGWLASPGHCENIMDRRFAEMGLAWAPGAAHLPGPYWVQLLVEPAATARTR